MSEIISLRAKATIPPGDAEFLKKVELGSVFGIDEGSFRKQETRQGVDELALECAAGIKNIPKWCSLIFPAR